jgi:hypothetical protein
VGNPATMVLAKNAVAPKFTGRRSDFMTFVRDWETYVRLMGGRHSFDDEQLLSLLSLSLDEAFKVNLNCRMSSKALVSFQQFWAELEAEFGFGSGVGNRQTWEALALKFDGLLTLAVFREFWEKFLMLRATISRVTDE